MNSPVAEIPVERIEDADSGIPLSDQLSDEISALDFQSTFSRLSIEI